MKIKPCLATKTEARIPGFSFAAKSRRTRQNTGWYFPGIVAILLNLAANQPETRLTEVRARKNDDSTEFRIYHTTLCSYHTTPQENQISGKYHSFTSKWQALGPSVEFWCELHVRGGCGHSRSTRRTSKLAGGVLSWRERETAAEEPSAVASQRLPGPPSGSPCPF